MCRWTWIYYDNFDEIWYSFFILFVPLSPTPPTPFPCEYICCYWEESITTQVLTFRKPIQQLRQQDVAEALLLILMLSHHNHHLHKNKNKEHTHRHVPLPTSLREPSCLLINLLIPSFFLPTSVWVMQRTFTIQL